MGVDQGVVLDELRALANGAWSSDEVALLLGAKERRVRAAIGWLIHHGVVEVVGVERRITSGGYPYQTTVYRLSGRVPEKEKTPPDWRGVYAAFGLL